MILMSVRVNMQMTHFVLVLEVEEVAELMKKRMRKVVQIQDKISLQPKLQLYYLNIPPTIIQSNIRQIGKKMKMTKSLWILLHLIGQAMNILKLLLLESMKQHL
jgi:hypothetical protein